jgi:23S rRNA (uracil1939-C5)-methyltransferase/tRNA (uracil-5-)-methyltransferase
VEIEITDVNNLGVGVGRVGNWVVMVPGVCVGEIAVARIHRNAKNYSLGDLVSVLTPSVDRIAPRCPLFGVCGGCQYQHLTYAAQLRMKEKQIADAVERLAGVKFPVNPCLGCDLVWEYRFKLTPHFRRTVPPIGFLACGTGHIVDVPHCPIATAAINGKLAEVRQSTVARAASLKRGGTLLLRDTGDLVATDPRAVVEQRVGDFRFSYRAGEFFQTNGRMLPTLLQYVVQAAAGPAYLIDAYCGVGVFGIAAAKAFERVVGVEIGKSAVELARENALKNGITNGDFLVGTAGGIFGSIDFRGDDGCVVIDPPRTGCTTDFIDQLLAFAPRKIVYVSCAPDTQARDLRLLLRQYHIVSIQPIDMFPQTRHVENVVVLAPGSGA